MGISPLNPTFETASPRFQLDAAVAEYAEILRKHYWALEGSMEDVRAVAGQVSGLLPGDRDVTEFLQLVTQAAGLASQK
ncbi:MAG: hypothetical protein QGH15_18460 [Kiritimatiellia bacterium]|jgi:hypothetical protein|nr:hypothetical protein [Kiritimatiellia bacterium]